MRETATHSTSACVGDRGFDYIIRNMGHVTPVLEGQITSLTRMRL